MGDGRHHVVFHLGQLAQTMVLLDEHLGHLTLDGEQPFPLGVELVALGDVARHRHVARVARPRAGW